MGKERISIKNHNHWEKKSDYVQKKHVKHVLGLEEVKESNNQGGESSCCKDPCTGCCSGGD